MFIATINVPGYLPMDDDPPTFDTAREAWEYLVDERRTGEDDAWDVDHDMPHEPSGYSATFNMLERRAEGNWDPAFGSVDEVTGEGTVTGGTPGYEGDHDLGLAYTVSTVEGPHD